MSLVDKSTAYSGLDAWDGGKFNRIVYTIDFSATGYSLAQNDVLVIEDDLTLGTAIFGTIIKVTTAQATISDIDVGLDSTATHVASDTLIDGADISSTGWVGNGSMDATPTYVTASGTGIVLTNKDAQTLNSAVIELHLFVANV